MKIWNSRTAAPQASPGRALLAVCMLLLVGLVARTSHAGGVTIFPSGPTVMVGGMQTFMAMGGTAPYTWTLTNAGSGPMASITSPAGVYTAGGNAGTDTVTATDSAGMTATADITVTVKIVPIGTACMNANACPVSGGGKYCIDGVCCSSSCGGICQACNVAGHVGTCVTISGPPIGSTAMPPTRSACPQSDPKNICTSKVCDGTSPTACTSLVGIETTCGIASCVDGIGTPGAVCQGDGGCQPVVPASCGEYACVSDMCATSCTDTSECSPGNYCEVTTGKCIKPPPVPDAGTGAPTATQATSGGCSMGRAASAAGPFLIMTAILGVAGVARRRRRPVA